MGGSTCIYGLVRKDEKHLSVLATGLFQDDFQTCIDLNDSVLHNNFKATALLRVAEGQIRFQIDQRIDQRNNIRAFVQWKEDVIRTRQDPALC